MRALSSGQRAAQLAGKVRLAEFEVYDRVSNSSRFSGARPDPTHRNEHTRISARVRDCLLIPTLASQTLASNCDCAGFDRGESEALAS